VTIDRVVITNHKQILKEYVKLWFFIDFFAILPGFLDLVGLGSGSVIFYLRLLR
jgi:hypothetical protein